MKLYPWTLLFALSLLLLPTLGLAQDETPPAEPVEETEPVEEAEVAEEETEAAEAAVSSASVARSAICTSIEEHEPAGAAEVFASDVGQLFCFTQIAGGSGQTVTHAWIHEGTTRARVELSVGSDMWRTYSSKTLLPGWTGNWQVKVLTEAGAVLQTIEFTIGDEP